MALALGPPQHIKPAAQCPFPQATPAGSAKARDALPKPRKANAAPPTVPLTSLNASLRETGLAMIRDTSSKSELISFLRS